MNTTVTPKLNFFRHGNDLKNWNANCWFCQIILMQMEQMLKLNSLLRTENYLVPMQAP